MADMSRTYSLESFRHGDPERVMQAEGSPRVLVFWPHGHEKLGADIGHHLYTERPDLLGNVDYLCGSPGAAAMDQERTVDGADLNRSFHPDQVVDPTKFEHGRAKEVLGIIAAKNYDYVLDVHTTTTKVGRLFIVDRQFFDTVPNVRHIVGASAISRVVAFPRVLSSQGLIGNVPNSISVEYNEKVAERQGVEEVVELIDNLVAGNVNRRRKRQVYTADADDFKIPKLADGVDDPSYYKGARNFALYGASYPIMWGPNLYRTDPTKDYLAFKANSKEVITI